MKKIFSIILSLCLVIGTSISAQAATLPPTKEFNGVDYYRANTKEEYRTLVYYMIENMIETIPIYNEDGKVEYKEDERWHNNAQNFVDYKGYHEYKFLDYNVNSIGGYYYKKPIFDENNNYISTTKENYGELQIRYNDNAEELKKGDAMIDKVIAEVKGKSKAEQVIYFANYVCSVADYGSKQLPGGGYDLINGVHDMLTGNHTNVVCTSFAMLLQRFLERAGIESVMIHNINHIWNMVCLDGVWYGVDATFGDDGKKIEQRYLLMGYDELRGYDNQSQNSTPIATFKATHTVAEKSYFNNSNNGGGTASSTSSKPNTNTVTSSKPSTNTATSSKPEANNSETDTPTDSTESVADTTSTESPVVNEVKIDLTENKVVSADIFITAKQTGDQISIVGENYSWKFSGDTLKDTGTALDFNAEVYVGEAVPKEAVEAVKNATSTKDVKTYPFSFSHHGELPGEAAVTIEVEKELCGKTVYIYYLNDKNKPVLAAKEIVDGNGELTFATDHCSVWFLSEEKIETGNNVILLIMVGVIILVAVGISAFFLIKRKRID